MQAFSAKFTTTIQCFAATLALLSSVSMAAAENMPEGEAEIRVEIKSVPKSESKLEVKPESKSESQPEYRSDIRPEAKPQPAPETFQITYDIRPLKGKLDHIPMLNSNSPEIVPRDGILLSTLNPAQTKHPEAHLNYAFKGPFSIFFHHINRQEDKSARKLLTISLLAFNPGSSKAILTFNALASYVSQPDAPVYVLPPLVADDQGKVYAGQGDRVVSDYIRGTADLKEPYTLNVAPRSYCLITELPVKVYGPVSTLNGRTYFANAQASKPLQFAILASFSQQSEHLTKYQSNFQPSEESSTTWHSEEAKANMTAARGTGTAGDESSGSQRLAALVKMADEYGLAGPREGDKRDPTPPHSKESIVYGRVSGIQMGSKYLASHTLALQPTKDLAVAYPISTVEQGTMGTGEVQAAPLIRRYTKSAYAAHGNYCVHYQMDLNLVNRCKKSRFVDIALSSPLKTDRAEKSLAYFNEQDRHVFFRGVIKVEEADAHGKLGKGTSHVYHLVAHRGEKLPPFSRFELEAGTNKLVRIELYYTPDATPPQTLTIDSPAIK